METAIIVLSWIGTSLTSITLIPQTYKVIKTKDTHSISLVMFLIFVASAIVWILYGSFTNQPAIIVTNSLVLVFSIFILNYKLFNIKTKKERI